MAEPMTTLSVEEFATKLAQLLGGQSSRVEENGSTFFHIDGLGERYVWVSFGDVDRLMHVGLQSIRGLPGAHRMTVELRLPLDTSRS